MIDQRGTIHFGTLLVGTKVNMYLRTRTARTCVTHFPEIIMLIAIYDM